MSEKEEHWQDENIAKARAEAASTEEAVETIEFAGEKARKPSLIYLAVKRTVDVVGSLVGLILCSLVFLVVAVVIKREDGGPVIHKRYCVGKDEKEYIMYKFRSMKVNADELLEQLTPEQQEEYKKECKLNDDPRITKVGKVIRRASIDELPQLLTILKGDMSIVGPRPMVDWETDFFGDDIGKVLSVKPGLTGYWQVNGRSDATYESGKRQELELYYAEHQSLLLDLKIIVKTFGVVLGGEGAK